MRMGAIPRMTAGLVSLAVMFLLAADLLLGLFPNEAQTRKEINTRLAYGLATQVAALLQRRDWAAVEQSLQAVKAGTEGMESLALRRADGRILAQAGAHPATWNGGGSVLALHVTVPLRSAGADWGQLEVAYRAAGLKDLPGWLFSGPARLLLLFSAVASLAYYLYLRRMLEHLDPGAAVPDRVRSAFDTLVEGVMVVDLQGRILLVNKALELLRPPGDERPLIGLRAQAMHWLQPADPGADPAPWLTTMHKAQPARALRFVVVAPDQAKALAHVTLNCTTLIDEQGGLRGCLVSLGDVTELELSHQQLMEVLSDLAMSKKELVEKNEALELLANHDPLSGCLNRRAFFDLGQALYDRARFDGSPLVCVMADIDHFKNINDTYGHGVGDQAIQRFAALLRQLVRPGDLLGRYGGEEFCLVLPGADMERGRRLAEMMRKAVNDNNGDGLDPGPALAMSASFGVAGLDAGTRNLAALIDRADHAMYRAKNLGRNRVVLAQASVTMPAAASGGVGDMDPKTPARPAAAATRPPPGDLPLLTRVVAPGPASKDIP